MNDGLAGERQADAMQVVMIGLGEEKFALDAGLVREIIDPFPVTKVAGARAFVPSVINVRGNVIPLADLRIRFGMPQLDDTAETRIVVIELDLDGEPVWSASPPTKSTRSPRFRRLTCSRRRASACTGSRSSFASSRSGVKSSSSFPTWNAS